MIRLRTRSTRKASKTITEMGYDISDYYAIDPVFGTMEDMDVSERRLLLKGYQFVVVEI